RGGFPRRKVVGTLRVPSLADGTRSVPTTFAGVRRAGRGRRPRRAGGRVGRRRTPGRRATSGRPAAGPAGAGSGSGGLSSAVRGRPVRRRSGTSAGRRRR